MMALYMKGIGISESQRVMPNSLFLMMKFIKANGKEMVQTVSVLLFNQMELNMKVTVIELLIFFVSNTNLGIFQFNL